MTTPIKPNAKPVKPEPGRLRVYLPTSGTSTVRAKFLADSLTAQPFHVAMEVTELSRLFGRKMQRGEVIILDPIGVIVEDDTGRVLYNPRDHYGRMPEGSKALLDARPEWPAVLGLGGTRR